jgi:hypothetical protein
MNSEGLLRTPNYHVTQMQFAPYLVKIHFNINKPSAPEVTTTTLKFLYMQGH